MTWYWNPHQSVFDLYDHNGDLVERNIQFSGSWETNERPNKVKHLIIDKLEEDINTDQRNSPLMSNYSNKILLALLREDVEKGTPE